MRLPVKDRKTIPYMTEREIPAIKAAISAWRKLRRDRAQVRYIRDRAGIVATPRTTAEQTVIDIAWNLEMLSQIEERIRKAADK